jgi:hypothetical protein
LRVSSCSGEGHVTVIRPLKMAANSIVDSLPGLRKRD